jgi:predicted GNAT family acetyltransferase
MEEKIEILKPEDWKEYKDIRLLGLKTEPLAYGASYEQEVNLPDEEWQKRLKDPQRNIYVARVEGRAVATAGARFEVAKNVEHLATIVYVFTHPEFRRKGIATMLMTKILDDLHKNNKTIKVRLSVNEVEVAARSMYKKLGFKEIALMEKEMKVGGKYHNQYHMEKLFEDKL